ncbi:Ribophorin I [Testicularia cyperi]|uniref:Dolichyl-diphosphooligosaccharide--protein glycosyltransferase subunit 1 n=1 Tax=Testicularia cyperi TaxID=1882483 RepID=A0A317XWU7_9BASI|nr:Ribophorin I [Testicularia cyperi]
MLVSPPRSGSLAGTLVLVLLLSCALAVSAVVLPASHDWTNLNYVKQLELTGSTSHSTVIVSVKPEAKLDSSLSALPYYFLVPANEVRTISWSRLTVKIAPDSPLASSPQYKVGLRPVLELLDLGSLDSDLDTHVFRTDVPSHVLGAEGITLTLELALNHATQPLPAEVKQTDPQLLLWHGDASIRSPYPTVAGSVKVKAPSPKIASYQPVDLATKSGSIVTYGPFSDLKPFDPATGIQQGSLHFQSDLPQASIVSLHRTAEISHWGDALSIEDRVLIRNTGPRLKGHFSRIEHQMAAFYKRGSANALSTFNMLLPSGARDPYFIDQIGNVSTSRFRPSGADPALLSNLQAAPQPQRLSLLELQPRFPLLGGWNYTFSVGFNVPLSSGGWGRKIPGLANEYVVAVPLFTAMKDVAVDSVVTSILLPEGSRNVQVELPFPMDDLQHGLTHTYLDTVGRPTITLAKRRCSSEHALHVYVRYTVALRGHLQKVLAVASISLLLFAGAGALRRADTRIR